MVTNDAAASERGGAWVDAGRNGRHERVGTRSDLARLKEAFAGIARRAAVGQHIVVLIARLDHRQPHLRAAFDAGHFDAGWKARTGRRRPECLQHLIPMSRERIDATPLSLPPRITM